MVGQWTISFVVVKTQGTRRKKNLTYILFKDKERYQNSMSVFRFAFVQMLFWFSFKKQFSKNILPDYRTIFSFTQIAMFLYYVLVVTVITLLLSLVHCLSRDFS